jgi:hypothetical protein
LSEFLFALVLSEVLLALVVSEVLDAASEQDQGSDCESDGIGVGKIF